MLSASKCRRPQPWHVAITTPDVHETRETEMRLRVSHTPHVYTSWKRSERAVGTPAAAAPSASSLAPSAPASLRLIREAASCAM